MNIHSIHHSSKNAYSYAYNENEIHLRLRAAKGDFNRVVVYHGDKFNWKNSKNSEMEKLFSDRDFDYYEISISPPTGRLAYYFHLEKGDKKIYFTDMGVVEKLREDELLYHYFQYPYLNKIDVHKTPNWVRDAVFYQIFPDRFYNGNPKINPENMTKWGEKPDSNSLMGGDIRGIIEKLDYLNDLGITAIYLTPIFSSDSNHKYDTSDYMEIDPAFGNKQDFRELIEKAHDLGMKLVLDAVFNHAGYRFFAFQDVLKKGRDSKYIDWFMIKDFPIDFDYLYNFRMTKHWSDLVDLEIPYETFANEPLMPKLNTSNKEVQDYLINVAKYWTKEFDLDGWRLDVADEVSNEFWKKFRRELKEIDEEIYICGEIWHGPQYWLTGDQYDSVMNYSIMYYCLEYFGYDNIDEKYFKDAISSVLMKNTWQVNEVLLNLLDSHDTARYITRVGSKEKLKTSLAFMMSYIGVPMIYYGTEIGMEGEHDPDCRRCMEWDNSKWDSDLRDYTKQLIEIRKDNIALRRGKFRWYESEEGVLAFERVHEDGKILFIFNNSKESKTLKIESYSEDLLRKVKFENELELKSKEIAILK